MTQKDVAERAGVSQPTVAGVLRGDPRVAAATRQRVLDAMRELNYRPHTAARDLALRRSPDLLSANPNSSHPTAIDIWWHFRHNSFHEDLYESLRSGFQRHHPEITVHVVRDADVPSEEVFDRLFLALATGASPHCHYLPQAHFQRFARLGLCADITQFVEEWPQSTQFSKATWEVVRCNGRYLGVPTPMASVQFLHLNRELCASEGLRGAPKTWAETLEWARQLTRRDHDQYGLSLPPLESDLPHFFVDLLHQYGGRLVRQVDGRYEMALDEEPAVEAMCFLQDLRWKYNVLPPQVVQTYEEQRRDLLHGRVAMTVSWPIIEHDAENQLTPEDLDLAPLPAGPDGVRSCQLGLGIWIINAQANPAQKRAAWEYLQFTSSREALLVIEAAHRRHGLLYPLIPTLRHFPEAGAVRKTLPPSWQKAIVAAEKNARLINYPFGHEHAVLRRILLRILTDPSANARQELQQQLRSHCHEIGFLGAMV